MPFTLQKRRYTHDWLLIVNGNCKLNHNQELKPQTETKTKMEYKTKTEMKLSNGMNLKCFLLYFMNKYSPLYFA